MASFQYDACLRSNPPPAALDFVDTQFFRQNASGSPPQLPTPATVRALRPGMHSGSVIFEDLALFVKFGANHKVSIEEAQTLQAIRRAFPLDKIPVPELVGWRRIEDINFIYMSLVPGVSLEASWPTFTEEEKVSISNQLQRMISLLRTLKQPSPEHFIGSISCTRIQDIFFHADVKAGPFFHVREFNDRLQFWAIHWLPLSQRPPDPFRALLPDTSNICFSHADLHLDNIIISGQPGSRSVAAIVDWGMSGWYPEYWEYCKAVLGTSNHQFETEGWPSKVLKLYDMEYEAFVNYWQWRGVP